MRGGGFISTNTLTVAAGQTVGVRGSSEIAVLGTANDATFGAGSFLTVADSSSSVIFGSNAGNTGGAITVVTGAELASREQYIYRTEWHHQQRYDHCFDRRHAGYERRSVG